MRRIFVSENLNPSFSMLSPDHRHGTLEIAVDQDIALRCRDQVRSESFAADVVNVAYHTVRRKRFGPGRVVLSNRASRNGQTAHGDTEEHKDKSIRGYRPPVETESSFRPILRVEAPMASTVWRGFITFGLVSVPVRLFRAARAERVSLRRLYRAEASGFVLLPSV